MLFELQRRERQGWTILAVYGELDLSIVPRVRAALRDLVPPTSSTPGARVVIDLAEVDFLDSAGLGVVLGAVRRVRAAGGIAVVVAAPSTSPGHLFGVLGLADVVPVAATVDDAVAGRTSGAATVPVAGPSASGPGRDGFPAPSAAVLVGDGGSADG